jgi:uncharacterized protein YdaU (DUF1376 family)
MNNDKKFHWFPFYYQAWMTDMNVQMLSHSEKGLYIDMLCSCFNEDGLPTDHKMLKRLFKCDDDDLQMVVTLFHERDGKLHNKKLDEIKAEQAEVSKKKSVAGKASAQARKAKRLAEATPVEQPLKSVATEAQQNPTSREEESREEERIEEEDIVGSEDPLELIWNNAPKKARERSSRKQLKTEWSKIKDKPSSDRLQDALNSWNKSQKWVDGFAEGIHRWIKNEQWFDLPEPKQEESAPNWNPVP